MNISCLRIKNNYLSAWRRTEDYKDISGAEIAEVGQYGLSIIPALENSYQYNCEAIANTIKGSEATNEKIIMSNCEAITNTKTGEAQ